MKNLMFVFAALFLGNAAKSQSDGFIENKGQWHSRVKFSANYGNSNFFLQSSGYKIALNNPADVKSIADYFSHHGNNVTADTKLVLHSHAYEVKFSGAATNAEIVPGDATSSFNNYLTGNDASKWSTGCKIYQSVTYKNIYPGIDVKYYSNNQKFKYDFIVNPGADVSMIALVFDGASGLTKVNENLFIKTTVGNVSELKPYTFQEISTGKTEVKAQFSVVGNEVHFKVDDYDRSQKLVIDPSLVFATFSGSTADNWGYAGTYDAQGNSYLAGIVFGNGFPVSNGAYQTKFGGGTFDGQLSGYDIAVLKLNSTGTNRLYGTYLGGTGNEEPHNLRVDKNGDLIITGITSSANFPATAPILGPGGQKDIFIAKLNANGTALLGSRKIGGAGDDAVNIRSKEFPGATSITRNYGDDARSEVVFDDNNNIYFAACTGSTDFPVTQNSFQKTLKGHQDAVIIKLSGDLNTLVFSSFLGGSGDDGAFSLALNPINNHIYVAGSTTSNDLPTTGDDSGPILYKTFRGGVCDGFIADISNDGSSLINMRYVGTNGSDMLYELAVDNNGYPYIMGTSTVAFPVVNAAFTSQSSGKQFISKLNTDFGKVVYSTNFGKDTTVPGISPTAFGLDDCENVYVAGWGGGIDVGEGYPNAGTTGLSVTSDAIRTTTDGSDFYIFVLEKNGASQLYGTFFGNIDNVPDVGDHTDGGNSRFDNKGNLYLALCANCGAIGVFPTTPGVWGPDNLATTGAKCSMAGLKIAMNLSANCALPVILSSFTATYKDHQSLLQWKTTGEINSSYFDIEHSTDAQHFSAIGRVNAAGNSTMPKNYQYIHKAPSAGLHYYRLKMADKDDKPTTSTVVSVLVSNNGKPVYLYPNPAKSLITLVYPHLEKQTSVMILNNKGTIVVSTGLLAGSSQKEINIQALPAGWYILQFGEKNNKQNISFFKE